MEDEQKSRRNAEFYKRCVEILKKHPTVIALKDAIELAVMSPASSYFISEKWMAEIIRSNKQPPRWTAKKALFHDIKERSRQLKLKHPDKKPETIAKRILIFEKAPRFYFSLGRAKNIYYEQLRKRRKQRLKMHNQRLNLNTT